MFLADLNIKILARNKIELKDQEVFINGQLVACLKENFFAIIDSKGTTLMIHVNHTHRNPCQILTYNPDKAPMIYNPYEAEYPVDLITVLYEEQLIALKNDLKQELVEQKYIMEKYAPVEQNLTRYKPISHRPLLTKTFLDINQLDLFLMQKTFLDINQLDLFLMHLIIQTNNTFTMRHNPSFLIETLQNEIIITDRGRSLKIINIPKYTIKTIGRNAFIQIDNNNVLCIFLMTGKVIWYHSACTHYIFFDKFGLTISIGSEELTYPRQTIDFENLKIFANWFFLSSKITIKDAESFLNDLLQPPINLAIQN